MSKIARTLLERSNADFDIEYGGFLSNHTAHGIIVLDLMQGKKAKHFQMLE